jgi:4-diphosphocytidyl-2-C-methyl-D-erythritol kinase
MEAKAPAKLNIFLKITGTRGGYHELLSRFVRYEALHDTITFIPQKCEGLTITGLKIPPAQNIVKKAYDALADATGSGELGRFFAEHRVHIDKRIPMGAGLGGGSSDAATFLLMANEACGLRLSRDDLAAIGARVGADVPFFAHGHTAANVAGIGEIIEPFDDEIPPIELKLIPIHCDTARVYERYRRYHFRPDPKLARQLAAKTSAEILGTIPPQKANDLFAPAVDLCPELADFAGWYLSGSGSTLFRRAQ